MRWRDLSVHDDRSEMRSSVIRLQKCPPLEISMSTSRRWAIADYLEGLDFFSLSPARHGGPSLHIL